ncbi:hypothetical protein C8R45DRAFT_1003695 [Mycena sanguinolenta]|nr:hypothetical protein C8R45DRAFT_1003695 [Mycena sanguinolenta]
MHRALSIREVVEMACCHLLPNVHDVGSLAEGRKALLALASTCKVLLAPALDTLWRDQNSIVPWLSCFPEDLFNMPPALASEESPLRLIRPLAPEDWERSDLNAVRVEKLSFEFETRFAQVFPALSISFPSGSIFPRLRNLSWSSTSEEDFSYIRIFLAPGLSSISITYEPSIVNCFLLSTLAKTCSQLADVEIDFADNVDPSDSLAVDSTSQFLQSLRRVESLTVQCVDLPALKHIGQLHGLTYLCLHYLPDGPHPHLHGPPLFRSLRNLTLTIAELPMTIHIIRMGSQIPLESLSLGMADFYPAEKTEELYNALAGSCSHASLIELTISCPGGHQDRTSGPNASRYAINSHSLRILFCFGNIETLSITSPVELDISDSTLRDAARAWPRLERIELKLFHDNRPRTSRLTVQSLYSLAEYCPRLRSVQIAIDGTVDITITSHALSASPHRLTNLCVAHSAISKPGSVARILSRIFPNLRTITLPMFYGTVPNEIHRRKKLWEEVEVLLPEFATAREEERARIGA